MTKTYAVTGGAGFIGSHIAATLLKKNHTVHVIDNFLTGNPKNLEYLRSLDADFVFHEINILDREALTQALQGVEIVFHQAALPSVQLSMENPFETHQNCVTGTLNVLDISRLNGVKRVVYAASSSAYGDQAGKFKDETMQAMPISPYGAAKLAGEYYCMAFNASYDLEAVALRYFNVFGPRQDPTSHYSAVIPKFIELMRNGTQPVIYGDGSQSRDFTFIDNVVHGNLLASESEKAPGNVMNLATGGSVDLLELVSKLNQIMGMDFTAKHDPPRTGDILHSMADVSKAGEILGYEPVVDFDTGLERTVNWYLSQSS